MCPTYLLVDMVALVCQVKKELSVRSKICWAHGSMYSYNILGS